MWASTRKGSQVYLHLFATNLARVELPALPVRVKSVARLHGGKVKWAQEGDRLVLTLNPAALDPIDTVIKLTLAGSAMDIPAMAQTKSAEVKAAASNVYQKQTEHFGPQEAFDGDAETRWATDGGTRQAWIAADLGKPRAIQRVRIAEAYAGRVQKFEFQHQQGDAWQTIFAGQKLGSAFEQSFPPVTAQAFRLNILDATDGPTISEIELLEK